MLVRIVRIQAIKLVDKTGGECNFSNGSRSIYWWSAIRFKYSFTPSYDMVLSMMRVQQLELKRVK
jgi:hypothetical protein